MENGKPKLKLYVVGETSPDHNKWRSSMRIFVVAESEEEALDLVDTTDDICEIDMRSPLVLF